MKKYGDYNEPGCKLMIEDADHYAKCIKMLQENNFTELETVREMETPYFEYGPVRKKKGVNHMILFRNGRRVTQRTRKSIKNLRNTCGVELHANASLMLLSDLLVTDRRSKTKVKRYKIEVKFPNGKRGIYNSLKHFVEDQLPQYSSSNDLRMVYKKIKKNKGKIDGYKVKAQTEDLLIAAIRHGCRAEILRYLMTPKNTGRVLDICCVADKTERYVLAQMKALMDVNLVTKKKIYRKSYYKINPLHKKLIQLELADLEKCDIAWVM
jgi:hypothetical protein